MITHAASRGPVRGSHLRHVSTGDSPAAENGKVSATERSTVETLKSQLPEEVTQRTYNLSIHEETVSKDDVMLNPSHPHNVHVGDLLLLIKSIGSHALPGQKSGKGVVDPTTYFHFLYKPIDEEVLAKYPALQVSVSRRIAAAFGFEKGIDVLITKATESDSHASHVEIVFRDQYLARADMWRLVVSELRGRCIHRGQKIEFMSSIRAQIKNIFVQGGKVQSAFFDSATKPIFRSESARYVLFIQMSKEMWDFDAEGTGEIMFDKIINGFLPELFKRWHELKVKHLVSIVLFTKMIYDEFAGLHANGPNMTSEKNHEPSSGQQKVSQDFYRVVVSDMASGEWANILSQLKREFKVFLRDISIRKPDTGDHLPLGEGLSSALADPPSHVIAGHPSSAIHGNLLEAINLASSQFSSDYIDRDLVRTGVSIMVLSPGAGVFEVDYDLLVATSENLIDNSVGIDLVCLSRMPLHSVPLFRYHPPPTAPSIASSATMKEVEGDDKTPTGSFTQERSPGTPPSTMIQTSGLRRKKTADTWSYGIPHWIDVSFWNSSPGENTTKNGVLDRPKEKSSFDNPRHKTFVPRVKMYEIQMMGVMENAISDISIPRLPQTIRPAYSHYHGSAPTTTPRSAHLPQKLSVSNSIDSGHEGHITLLSSSFASDRSAAEGNIRPQFQWMDNYDDLIFRHPTIAKTRSRRLRSTGINSKTWQNRDYSPSLLGTSAGDRNKRGNREGSIHVKRSHPGKENLKRRPPHDVSSRNETAGSNNPLGDQAIRPKVEKTTRQISFGPRGFSAKAVASTEITAKHSEGSLLSRGLRSGISAKPVEASTTGLLKPHKNLDERDVPVFGDKSSAATTSSESKFQQSRPIPIRNATTLRISGDPQSRSKPHRIDSHDHAASGQLQDRLAALQDLRVHEEDVPRVEIDDADEADDVEDTLPLPVVLSPSTTLAPWLTILNPSNPSKTKKALATRLGRWQHVFPRPPKNSQIKWKSLCSPAAVPLTTEDFPSAEQLAEEYETTSYDIEIPENSEIPETARSIITEILAFRMSRGFQLIVGPRIAESTEIPILNALNIFDEQLLGQIGTIVFLSRGSTLHRISRMSSDKIEVKQLFRYSGEPAKGLEIGVSPYKPFIRSMLAHDYEPQQISIAPYRANFDWKTIDAFIAGHERPKAQDFVESLRPWRARFVLIPVEASSNARRRQRSDEDDEEEIRLEGIRKLTQVWQKFRYIPSDERRYQAAPPQTRKDTNPLDIMYQTRNPSAIIAAELENVAEGDATGRPVQLLPESDLYQRSSFAIAGLAETIQSEKGVRMLDRRWHLRLHFNCFIGFELTTWLLQNFRDVDTRDEAVELGNELMKNGMFRHVEQRHNFRDGNYFYQISDEYRTPRPESRSWFSRGKASVPPTPMSEDVPRDLPAAGRSRSSSNSNSTDDDDPTTPTGKKKKQQLSVALSKFLIYDVDHRKRSYRPELINLHYDRLHNPDNCYHIRVEWMNTTPKLIQDAVVSWATSVDRFGLRLVEVPLGEASSITSMHPFRAPYVIKLAHRPPERQPQSYFDNTSFAPAPKTEKNFYQKAILKRFNFVLDFEAASDFPVDVDVTYSWGKPDYQYPQYIHRSGMLIGQITDSGDFLVLANRLYSSRNAGNPSKNEIYRADQPSEGNQNRGPNFFRASPHRGNHGPSRPSPHDSPYHSPSIRATLEVPSSANLNRGLPTFPSASRHVDPTASSPKTSYTAPEAITKDLENFCHDKETLSHFYEEVLSKASTPGPNTPFMASQTPDKTTASGFNESSIPTLALPGSVVEKGEKKEGSGKNAEAKTRIIGSESPRVFKVSSNGSG